MFVVKNRDLFELNSNSHKISKRYNNDLHLPSAQLKFIQELKRTSTSIDYQGVVIWC